MSWYMVETVYFLKLKHETKVCRNHTANYTGVSSQSSLQLPPLWTRIGTTREQPQQWQWYGTRDINFTLSSSAFSRMRACSRSFSSLWVWANSFLTRTAFFLLSSASCCCIRLTVCSCFWRAYSAFLILLYNECSISSPLDTIFWKGKSESHPLWKLHHKQYIP